MSKANSDHACNYNGELFAHIEVIENHMYCYKRLVRKC